MLATGVSQLCPQQEWDGSPSRTLRICSGRGPLSPKATQDAALILQALAADSILE